MSSFETIIYEVDGPLARITLNRPRVLNAYNIQMRDDLYEALTAVADDPQIRVLLIAGAGDRAFCAGADLTEFGTA
ncbi:MAG: enoyl-CoA hydratase/isomerase family protein, partial [Dehalococcoidia bacterium]